MRLYEDLKWLNKYLLQMEIISNYGKYFWKKMLKGSNLDTILNRSTDYLSDHLVGKSSNLFESDIQVIGDHIVKQHHSFRRNYHFLWECIKSTIKYLNCTLQGLQKLLVFKKIINHFSPLVKPASEHATLGDKEYLVEMVYCFTDCVRCVFVFNVLKSTPAS